MQKKIAMVLTLGTAASLIAVYKTIEYMRDTRLYAALFPGGHEAARGLRNARRQNLGYVSYEELRNIHKRDFYE